MKQLEEIEIDNEVVYFRKGFLGWHIVYPIREKGGKINWKNLIAGGSWWKLLIIALIVLLILGCVYEYSVVLKSLNECMDKPNLLKIIT